MDPQQLIQMLMAGGEQNPEEGDPYQVAGDVVPMRGIVRPQDANEFNERMGRLNADPRSGQRGMQSIERFGGKQGPYLDLMDILMMNRGR